jgi:uncharacterized protein YcfJ
MKTFAVASTVVLSAVALASPSWAQAQSRSRPYEPSARVPSEPSSFERGTVISVTPIVEQVAVAHRVCHDEPVSVQRQPSGAGALVGAIAGAALGNAVGAGTGRAAATALGFLGGAVVGNNIESGGQPGQVQSMRRCTTENAYEDRTTSYSVVYEYGGREYTTQMRRDPGRYVQIQVQAAPEGDEAPREYRAPPPRARSAPPVSSRPAPVYVERPVYERPVYVERPVYQSRPEPVYESYPAYPAYPPQGPAYYGPGPEFGTGLVLGALIGYGVHHGYRHHGWRRGR